MKRLDILKWFCLFAVVALALHADAAHACAACFGKSDSPLAQGMNWGIFSLLGVVVTVLGGIACCGFFLVRRAAAYAASISPSTAPAPSSTPSAPQGELVASMQKA
jgi:hypothetical protein